MADDLARLGAASERFARQRQSIVARLVKALLGLWGDFSAARDDVATLAIVARSAVLASSATKAVRLQARSYLGVVSSTVTDRLILPKMVDPYPRSGVSALEVYQRPAGQFIHLLSQGATLVDAREGAQRRLESIAGTDVLLADRDESQRVFQANRGTVVGYRRVIHPELAESGTCGLCAVASQQFYTLETLKALHDGCNCTVMPYGARDDPGLRLNQDDLKNIYALAGSTYAKDLLNTRISVTEHGELGPVLVKQGDHFRTAAEAGRPEYVKPTPEGLRAANRKSRVEAEAKLTETREGLSQIPQDTTDAELMARRAKFVQAQTALSDYIRALDAAHLKLL